MLQELKEAQQELRLASEEMARIEGVHEEQRSESGRLREMLDALRAQRELHQQEAQELR